jgi:uncharacterized protein (UPF0548 family)
VTDWVFGRVPAADAWAALEGAAVNYSMEEVRPPEWNIDVHRHPLPAEPPGPPVGDGVWERACRLVRDYEFSPPELVRALYDPDQPLLGRNMLLEARFHGLHFYCGVRVTDVVDESRDGGERVWGWAYETLDGHLERGRVDYEVVKHQHTGEVEFVARSHSQAAPTLNPVLTLGWRLFGRGTQLRFYRRCGQRLRELLDPASALARPGQPQRTAGGLLLAPSDARAHRLDALSLHLVAPG